MGKKAVVLLSGGIDSTTVLALAKEEGFEVYALTIDYGQRHRVELDAARKVAQSLGVREHKILRLDLRSLGGRSALTSDTGVPKSEKEDAIGEAIPVTYVPGRNTIFLAVGLAWAEAIGAGDLFIGVTAVDYSGYPDCRPEYIEAFQRVADLGTKVGVEGKPIRIRAPLVNSPKREIIRKGSALGVDYSLTHSCYDPSEEGAACGKCESCVLRKKAFADAGIADPTKYVDEGQRLGRRGGRGDWKPDQDR